VKTRINKALALPLIVLVRTYQILLSSWLPQRCRFYPPCSQYMLQALRRYGAFKGTWLGLRRLARCHPLNPGGYDPLPEA
jgi:putative membrane protein insertion efficiency factor